MAISADLKAKILRYFHAEKWPVGTIASKLHVHHTTVKRVLAHEGVPKGRLCTHKSMIDPFVVFIEEQLTTYPDITAARLYHMVCGRGYDGGPDHFRHRITLHRPRKIPEAYLRLRTLPGEQAQVDWGHFGHIKIGRAKRPLMAFVMVLSYSRQVFLRFYLNQQMENFLRGHIAAFNAFGGVPRVILYDNLKSAVLERLGQAIRFHPTLLEFSGHYRYEPRPVAVARGNEKGRVERTIRYIRTNFFMARQYKDWLDLNAQADHWCNHPAANRPCPEDKTKTVAEVFLEEKDKLLTLPDNPYPAHENVVVRVPKTPYVRFDLNDYTVPHTYTRTTLNVVASLDTVKILDADKVIAEHARSFDKAAQIENQEHIKALVERKKKATQSRGQDRLTHAVPCAKELLIAAAKCNYNMGNVTQQLNRLLDDYGALALEEAIKEALNKDAAHPNTVRLLLQKAREAQDKKPLVHIQLPDDPKVKNLSIRPHPLDNYDQLQQQKEPTNDE